MKKADQQISIRYQVLRIRYLFQSKRKLPTTNYQLPTSRGFTLVELLVTISIIAILTSLLVVNFLGIRQRGRDAQRKANLQQMRSALEFYRTDNGGYPDSTSSTSNPFTASSCGQPFLSGTNTYMREIPCDPLSNTPFMYITTSDSSYTIFACLENQNDSEKSTDPADVTASGCTSPSVPFKVTNP